MNIYQYLLLFSILFIFLCTILLINEVVVFWLYMEIKGISRSLEALAREAGIANNIANQGRRIKEK